MKKQILLILLTTVISFVFNANVYSQTVTIKWTNGEVKDSLGDELLLGSAMEVIMLPAGAEKLDPVFDNPFFIAPQERLIRFQGGFDNPLPYVPLSIPIHPHIFFQFPISDLPTPELGETLFLSIYLRVWDNIAFYNSNDTSGSFDSHGAYRGKPSLLDPNKYTPETISYYFDTNIIVSEINPFDATLEFVFDISGQQTDTPFIVPELAVPEPNAILLAGFGFVYILRKFRRK